MKRRKWDAKVKAQVVIQGLRGTPIDQICNEHQISQAMYYKWRDEFLSNAQRAFEQPEKHTAALKEETRYLKRLVGELTVELKKSEGLL